MIARGGEHVAQKEEEMRKRGFRVKCECGFDGLLLGTAWKGLVELDFSESRTAQAHDGRRGARAGGEMKKIRLRELPHWPPPGWHPKNDQSRAWNVCCRLD